MDPQIEQEPLFQSQMRRRPIVNSYIAKKASQKK